MKRTMWDLAVFGGTPEFYEPLILGRPAPFNRGAFYRRVKEALDREWLTNGGPLGLELEERIAELCDARFCVAVASGTSGIQLMSHALGLNGEVVVPSFTFAGTAHALRWIGLRPVFCDVALETGCISADSAASMITERTTAIMGVHLWGRICAERELRRIARDNGLSLIFDGAQALASLSSDGRPLGHFGDAVVVSFHATKVVHGFEGGAVLTNDEGLADCMRGLRNFGIGLRDGHHAGGTNAKMSEVAAAACLSSLEALPDTLEANARNAAVYETELRDLAGVEFVTFPGLTSNRHYAVLFVDSSVSGLSREYLRRVLQAEGVVTKAYFSPPCHLLPSYIGRSQGLPVAERLSEQAVALPTGPRTSVRDVRRVCNIIRLAVGSGVEISSLFKDHISVRSRHE